MFRKTTPLRVYEDLVEQIQQAILEGRLRPGDRLPSQRALMATFQTSRASIREALRVLEQKGLISIKLGVSGGAVVQPADTAPLTAGLTLLIRQQKVSFDHLAEFRAVVEAEVTALAARRAVPADIQALRHLLNQAEEALTRDGDRLDAFLKVDGQIHMALAAIAGNPVYMAALKMIHETILGSQERFALRGLAVLEENFRDLAAIVDAVAAAAPARARRLARGHVQRFNRYLKRQHTG